MSYPPEMLVGPRSSWSLMVDDSEYLAPCDERRAFITDFDGSAGTAIITHNEAMCWTDGRYWLQAEKQLGEGWTLMKAGLPEVPTWARWLKDVSLSLGSSILLSGRSSRLLLK